MRDIQFPTVQRPPASYPRKPRETSEPRLTANAMYYTYDLWAIILPFGSLLCPQKHSDSPLSAPTAFSWHAYSTKTHDRHCDSNRACILRRIGVPFPDALIQSFMKNVPRRIWIIRGQGISSGTNRSFCERPDPRFSTGTISPFESSMSKDASGAG